MQTPTDAAAPPVVSLRVLLTLAWPIVVSRASQVVVGFSDAVMVAELGAAALAATATGATNAWTLLIFPMGVSFIIASFASQFFGKGDVAGARRFGWYGLVLAGLTQVAAIVSLPFIDDVLSLFPYEPKVKELMGAYLALRLLSSGAAIGVEALANYYGGLGRTRPGMTANIVAMALNIVGNWIFIWGHFGAPQLGVRGAGLASALATWVGFLGFAAFFVFEGRGLPAAKLKLKEFQRLLRFGLPSGANWFFEFLAFLFFINVVVASLGTPALAAMNAVITLNSASFMPAFGLASAGAILVGQSIGAGRKDEVPGIVRLTFFTAGTYQGLVGVAYLLVPGLLMLPFVGGAERDVVLELGTRMLMVSAGWQLFDTAANALAEALRAAGDTIFPLVARLAVAWLVFVPGAYFTVKSFDGGDLGAMVWLVAYLGILAGVLFWRFNTGAWRHIELVEP